MGHLFDTLASPLNLRQAALEAARGKRRNPDVATYLYHLEERSLNLARQLVSGTWRPSPVATHRVRDPKPRVIAASTFADRVVHQALVEAIKPALLRSVRPEAMACLPRAGTHRAVLALQRHLRRSNYVLHLDVRAYFPSIDPRQVQELLARRVNDDRVLALTWRILEEGAGLYTQPALRRWLRLPEGAGGPGKGLPVGAYTSQAFASWLVLDQLDHEITRRWGVKGYVRYVDDLFLFYDRREPARAGRDQVASWLAKERGLQLKHPRAPLLSCAGTLDALGYRLQRGAICPRPRSWRRWRHALGTSKGWPGLGTRTRSVVRGFP